MIQATTLSLAFEAHLDNTRGISFIEGENKDLKVSYETQYKRSLGILYHLQKKGVHPDSALIVLLSSNQQFIDVFWAAIFGKIVPVPVAPGISTEHREKIFRIFQLLENPYFYTTRENLDRIVAYGESEGLFREVASLKERAFLTDEIDDIRMAGQRHQSSPQDMAFIQFSSGSTSAPKGVILTHENLMTNIKAISKGMAMTEEDATLSWMPLTHDMGLIGFHLVPFLNGVDHYIIPTEIFIRRPLIWLSKSHEKKANVLCSPNFGYRHYLNAFSRDKVEGLDLSHVRMIYNGAEPISVSLCKEFLSTLSAYGLRETSMFPVYGLAEASLAVTFPKLDTRYAVASLARKSLSMGNKISEVHDHREGRVEYMFVGKPVENCEVRIVDSHGLPVEEREIGTIEIRGKNVTRGYYCNPEANSRLINAQGWLDTGDVGFLQGGALVITGRKKDILFVHGQNYYPHDLEQIIIKADEAELGKVAVCGVRSKEDEEDGIVVFLHHRGNLEVFVSKVGAIRKIIGQQLGIVVDHVIPVQKLPKTTSGKPQRYLLSEWFLQGKFRETLTKLNQLMDDIEQISFSRSRLEQQLQDICNEIVPDKGIGVTDNIFEMGANSLTLAQIHERMDEVWPDKIEVRDFLDYPTIRELAEFLESKLKETPDKSLDVSGV